MARGARDGRALPSCSLRAISDMMQRLDLTDNERAVLITALRRLVEFDPRALSLQTQALKAILERLDPHKSQPYPILRAPAEPTCSRFGWLAPASPVRLLLPPLGAVDPLRPTA